MYLKVKFGIKEKLPRKHGKYKGKFQTKTFSH